MPKNMIYSILFVLLALAVIISCSQEQGAPTEKPDIVIRDAVQDADGTLKILVYYDMEGISGLDNPQGLKLGNEEYVPTRELLTKDVNAVIDGLVAGGADVVDVVDAHGSGSPNPDILLDMMDSRAKMLFKDDYYAPYIDLAEQEQYDAVAVVCMHSRTDGGGFASHTYSLGTNWIMNGRAINETEIIAYSWGRVDVPVIFASGDDRLKAELEYLDWIEYVTVKYAKTPVDVELRPLDEVHAEMRAKAKKAVENLSMAKAVRFTTPITAQLQVFFPADLSVLENVPGIDYQNNTVTFTAANYREAYDGILAFIGVAGSGMANIMREYIASREDAVHINTGYWRFLIKRLVDFWGGSWSPSKESDIKTEGKKYFGVR
ncbi:M55 family metallopeptidase [Acidobacteriota bacterium]